MLREMAVAWAVGAGRAADALFVAFRIPNLLRELLAEGAISAGFIPVFTAQIATRPREEARDLARAAWTAMAVILACVVAAGIIAAPWVVAATAPGFRTDPDKFALTVRLTRIIFPFLGFIGLAALAMGILNSFRRFGPPAFSSSFFNLVVLLAAAIAFVGPQSATGRAIVLAVGMVAGGAAQLLVQAPALYQLGMGFRWRWQPGHPELRRVVRLVLPMAVGLSVTQVSIIINTILASRLPEGSVAYLNYGFRLVHLPLAIFGVALGTALLPTISAQVARGEREAAAGTVSQSLRLVTFIILPAMAGLITLRVPIVQVLFEHGSFDAAATAGTAEAVLFYALGLWAFAGVRIVVPAFYAMNDTRTPVVAAAVATVANIVLNLALMRPLGHGGLALATAISAAINLAILAVLLSRRWGGLEWAGVGRVFLQAATGAILLGAVGIGVSALPIWQGPGPGTLAKILVLSAAIPAAFGVYLGAQAAMRSEELGLVWRNLAGRWRKAR